MRGMVTAMPRFDVRPSRPYAVLMAVGALAILIFGTVTMMTDGGFEWPFLMFAGAGLFIVVAVLTRAFGRGGSGAAERRERVFAVAGAIGGVGILIFGGFMLADTESPLTIAGFSIAGLAIIAVNLWSAFNRRD